MKFEMTSAKATESDMRFSSHPPHLSTPNKARDGIKPCPVRGRYLVGEWGSKG